VTAYLEDKGIPSSQLIPQGFGKTHFVATNSTSAGRAQNRRVELVPVDQ
jgi:outer membrane protein OmpA-like peptidoglycan-associated protein